MKKSFTLVELMIVVTIIGILAAIAVPRMSNLITKARDASTKGNLGVLRSAIHIYYADNLEYPGELTAGVVPKYISSIPYAYVSAHDARSNSVYRDTDFTINEDFPSATEVNSSPNAFWRYFTGDLNIACTHADTLGKIWTTY